MKYKLICQQTNEEHLCDKVTIDGFDYYVSDEKPTGYCLVNGGLGRIGIDFIQEKVEYSIAPKKVIATNNPNIDIPQVVDDVEKLASDFAHSELNSENGLMGNWYSLKTSYLEGYNKSQETHPFSEEDMIAFAEWLDENRFSILTINKEWASEILQYSGCVYTTKELLQLWKEQRPKIVYYG